MDVVIIGAAGAGKDSIFKELAKLDDRYERLAFADGIKDFLELQFPEAYPHGFDWDAAKKFPHVRKLLQDTGMAGREFNADMWIAPVIDELLEGAVDDRFVVTDARFSNELDELLNSIDFPPPLLVYINRTGVTDLGDNADHVSEHEWKSWIPKADLTFDDDAWTPESAARVIHDYINDHEDN